MVKILAQLKKLLNSWLLVFPFYMLCTFWIHGYYISWSSGQHPPKLESILKWFLRTNIMMSIIGNTLSKMAFFARNSRNLPLKHTWRKDQHFNQGSATHTSRFNNVSASPLFGLSPPCLFHTLHGLCLVFRCTCFVHFLWSLSIWADRWRHMIVKQTFCNCPSFTYSPEYFSLAASRPINGPAPEALISPCHSRGLYLPLGESWDPIRPWNEFQGRLRQSLQWCQSQS